MSSSRPYRPDIDGLRAIAVLLVVAFHAFPQSLPGGFIGVDVFFVISGYLITGLIIGEIDAGSFSLARFYSRRIRRILPALVSVLITAAVLGWLLLLPEELAQLGRHIAANTVFGSNWVLWGEDGYFDSPSSEKPLLHLWSLAIEEQFYVVWPAALLLLTRFRRGIPPLLLSLFTASLLLSEGLSTSDPVAGFYSPFSRAFKLLLGGLCAVRQPRMHTALMASSASVLGLALIGASSLRLNEATPFPGLAALVPCFGAALVIAAGPGAVANRHVLATPLAVHVGLLSYPLYLWHWTLLSFAEINEGRPPESGVRIGLVLVSVVLAWLTWRFVERPIRAQGSRRATALLIAAFGGVGLVGLSLDRMEGVISRFPPEIQAVIRTERYDYSGDARVGTCWLGDLPSTPFAPECAGGPDGRQADLLIWGDSHAGRLYAGVRRILGSEIGVGQLTRDECPPLVAFGSANCVEGNAAVFATLEKQRPRQILLFGYWDFYARNGREAPAIRTALERTIEALRAVGIQDVLVMGPAPRWREGLPRRVYRQWAADFPRRRIPERLASGFDTETFELDAALRPSVEAAGGAYVSVLDILCDADGCLSAVPGSPSTLLAWDYGHLTTAGAELIARRLRAMGLLHVRD